jgi:hypothetical protein
MAALAFLRVIKLPSSAPSAMTTTNSPPLPVMLARRLLPSYTESQRSDSCVDGHRLVDVFRDRDLEFLRFAPCSVPAEPGLRFLSGRRAGLDFGLGGAVETH